MPDLKEVEQQITALAARSDPDAFYGANDRSLHERRRTALSKAAETIHATQVLLAFGAVFLVGAALVTYVILT